MSSDITTQADGGVTVAEATGVDNNDDDVPARIGRFFIFRQLGEGGMGRVFLGYDEELDRKLAIKLWHGQGDSSVRVRMLREAQALARLSHPHIVTVYEVGEEQGRVYLAMEYVEGETLRRWVEDQPRSTSAILGRYLEAGSGLAAAHKAGILHRDFKPDNVIAGADDRVRVLDFGLARADRSLLSEESLSSEPVIRVSGADRVLDVPMTVVGTVLGTPAYMPPEQLRGEATDVRSDIFSFSVAFWEALFEVRPFRADSIRELSAKIEHGVLDEGKSGRRVPRRLRAALAKGLAADADDRWQTMDELLVALSRRSRRLRWLLPIAIVLIIALFAGIAIGLNTWRKDQAIAGCQNEARAIDAVWNDAVRRDLRATATATGFDYATASVARLEPILSNYAATWQTAAISLCEQDIRDSDWAPELTIEARACLEERSWALESLVVELSNATLARLQQALPAAYALPEIDRCLDPTWLRERPLPPSDASSKAEIDALREAIERTRSLEAIGRIDEALPIAETLVERADALGWKPLRARTRLLAGRLSEQQAIERAAEHLESGFFIALGADEEHLATELATRLVVAIGVDLMRPNEGHLWARWAKALIDRRPVGREMRLAALNSQLGVLAHSEGKLDEAEHAWQAALAIYQSILGPHHPNIAKLLNNLGALHDLNDNSDEAARLWERALSIWGASLGPDHPTTAAVHVNLGLVYERQGQYSKALASTERALVIWERSLGHEHPQLVTALNNIAIVQHKTEHYADSLATSKRALRILQRTLGANNRSLVIPMRGAAKAHAGLGNIEAAAADYERIRTIHLQNDNPEGVAYDDSQLASLFLDIDPERAEGYLQQAISGYEKLYGERSNEVLQTLLTISEQHLQARRPASALPLLERALDLTKADSKRPSKGTAQDTEAPIDPKIIAEINFALAKSIAQTDGDRQRIDQLLGRAESLYLALDAPPKETLKELRALRKTLTEPPSEATAPL